MTRWTPEARTAFLRQIGAESRFVRESRERSVRNGCPMPGDLGPVGSIEWLYSPPPVYQDVVDQEASFRSQRLVTRTRQINMFCSCGCAASVPPIEIGKPFVCARCDAAEYADERAAQSDAYLAVRSFAADLDELAGLYRDPFTR